MTKRQEILRLKSFVEKLPEDSYLRPWLEPQMPSIASAIQSDISPDLFALSYKEFRDRRQAEINGATAEAKAIVEKARREAEKVRQEAVAFDGMIRDRIMSAVRQIERIAND